MSLVRVSALGRTLTGTIEVTDTLATLQIEIPPLVSFLSETLRTFFQAEGDRILS